MSEQLPQLIECVIRNLQHSLMRHSFNPEQNENGLKTTLDTESGEIPFADFCASLQDLAHVAHMEIPEPLKSLIERTTLYARALNSARMSLDEIRNEHMSNQDERNHPVSAWVLYKNFAEAAQSKGLISEKMAQIYYDHYLSLMQDTITLLYAAAVLSTANNLKSSDAEKLKLRDGFNLADTGMTEDQIQQLGKNTIITLAEGGRASPTPPLPQGTQISIDWIKQVTSSLRWKTHDLNELAEKAGKPIKPGSVLTYPSPEKVQTILNMEFRTLTRQLKTSSHYPFGNFKPAWCCDLNI